MIVHLPFGMRAGPELADVVIRDPFQTKFQFCLVHRLAVCLISGHFGNSNKTKGALVQERG